MQHYDNTLFKIIKEFPRFEINCEGLIRSVKTKKTKYVLLHRTGYFLVQFHKDGKVFTRKVHRLVAENFIPPPDKALIAKCSKEHWGVVCVNHIDGNKENNHYTNLEWCDHHYNTKHASDTGLNPAPKGSLNGRSKLTEDLVHKICKFYEDGGYPKEAEKIFNISPQQATKIRSGHAWKHIWEEYNIKVNRRNKVYN